jgi:hypothetical protein
MKKEVVKIKGRKKSHCDYPHPLFPTSTGKNRLFSGNMPFTLLLCVKKQLLMIISHTFYSTDVKIVHPNYLSNYYSDELVIFVY